MKKIRVALVEDNLNFLEGINALLVDSPLIESLGQYTRGRDAITGIIETCPEIALIDLGLPDIKGIEVIEKVSEAGCNTEFLILTVCDDDASLFSALRAGAVGYLVKSEASHSEILKAIQEVINGGAPMSVGIARRIIQEFQAVQRRPKNPKVQDLTSREREILELVSKGFTTRRVADALCVSYETVRHHQKAIYRKLQVHSLVEAVAAFRGEKGGAR